MLPSTIIITGASSGLGAALAVEYARVDTILGLIGRDADRLEQTAALCRAKGAIVKTTCLTVTDAPALDAWLSEFDQAHPIELCIANAGISAGTGGGGESLEQIHRIFDVNFYGVINTIEPVIQAMKSRKTGQIALVSSIAGFRGSPTAPAYSASKAAVRIYGQALRGALQSDGIRVNVICPGFIRSPMTAVNSFPMPFIMEPAKAARIISSNLAADKGLIAFPWPMALLARIQNLLPDSLMNRLYKAVPAKPSA